MTTDLKSRGFKQKLHVMDNEAPTALEKTTTNMDITYQLVPPGNHKAKNAERAIKTFKKHFIAGL